MADEATKTEQDQKDEKGGEDQRIPYSRFEEVNNRAKSAEKELADLKSRLTEFEDRDKSEVERAQARAQRAESQLADLTAKVTGLEKGSWVRSAAAELNFHDPEDAVQHLRDQLAGLDDQGDARRLVKNLAKNKKHLVRDEKTQERPTIGQMFAGQQAQQNGGGGGRKTPQQIAAEQELGLAQGLADQLGQFRDKWQKF